MERREEERCIVVVDVVVVVDFVVREMWQGWGQQKCDACLFLAPGWICTAAGLL